MKHYTFSSLLFLLLFQMAIGQSTIEEKEIKKLVNQWNTYHNTKDLYSLNGLYGSKLLFYAKDRTKEQVLSIKKRLLQNPFEQKIISPIQVEYFSGGVAKASFLKSVLIVSEAKEYPAYLLFELVDGEAKITGESDLVSDAKKGFVLNPGLPANAKSNQSMLLVIGGLALLGLIGTFFWYRNKKKTKNLFAQNEQTKANASVLTQLPGKEAAIGTQVRLVKQEPKHPEKLQSAMQAPLLADTKMNSEYEKGLSFEKWVLERFRSEIFELIEWRGDKIHNGMYAKTNKLPDLEFSLTTREAHVRFAIECKWRRSYYFGNIELARQDQLIHYKEFEDLSGKKVFIMLGVGGKPDEPEELFVIPLQKIQHHKLDKSQLEPFRRMRRSVFFYNVKTGLIE